MKGTMNEENKNIKTVPEWADTNYQLYQTNKGLSPYYVRCKNTPRFYLLDYGIGDDKCKELPYSEYLDMNLKQTLFGISATEVDEVLLKGFFLFHKQTIRKHRIGFHETTINS